VSAETPLTIENLTTPELASHSLSTHPTMPLDLRSMNNLARESNSGAEEDRGLKSPTGGSTPFLPIVTGHGHEAYHKTKPNVMPPTTMDDSKLEILALYYHQFKVYSLKVLQAFEKLRTVTQDGRVGLLQEFISQFRMARDSLRRFIDSTTSIATTLELRRNGVDLLKYEILMTTEFLLGNGSSPNAEDFISLVLFI
jgi:hypothetical protein